MSYQALYIQVLQALPQAVCQCDAQGLIYASNPAAQALLGYAPEALTETLWLELIHISDQPLIEDCWQRLQARADVPPCRLRLLRGELHQQDDEGSAYVPVQVTFTATYDQAGALEHVLLWLVAAYDGHEMRSTSAGDVTEPQCGEYRDGHRRQGHALLSLAPTKTFAETFPITPSEAPPETPSLQPDTNADRVIAQDFYLDDSPAMIAVVDRQWRFVHVSEAAAALVNEPVVNLLGRTLWEVMPRMQHNPTSRAFQQAMDTGQALYYEFLAEDERLQGAWHGAHIIPFADHLIVKIEDLTARKTAQQRLVAAKHRAEVLLEQRNAILESISDYFFILNQDYRFIYANQAILTLFEETPASILNRTIWDVVPLPDGNPFRRAYVTAIQEQVPQRVRHTSSHPKLAGQTLEIVLYPFRGGVVGYSRDVTEFETLRQALDQALTDKETILNSITDGVTVLNRDWVYVYANRDVLERVPHIIGQNYFELFPQHRNSIFAKQYQWAFDSQKPVFFEAKSLTSDEWAEVRAFPAGDRLTIYTTNINERKRLEQDLLASNQKLRESETKFRAFFENSGTAHFILNVQQPEAPIKRFMTNRAFDDMFAGTHLADIDRHLTLADYQSISRQLSDDYYPLLERGLRGEDQPIRAPKRYLNRDGSSFWVDVSSVFVRDEQGKPLLVVSTLIDITSQKHTQQALAASEAKFRTFFEASLTPHQLIRWRADGTVEGMANRALADFLGVASMNFQGVPQDRLIELVAQVSHPEDFALEQPYLAELVAGERSTYRLEKRYVQPDGSVRWGDTAVSLVRQADGSALVLSSVQDITDIKRTEQALKTSEAKFRAFFENNATPCTMFIFVDEDERERGFHFNDAFADFLKDTAFAKYADRLSSVEDTMRALTAIAHPEDNLIDEHYVAEVMAGKRDNYHFEKRYFTRDGGIIWGDISSVFLRDEQGELTLGMSIIQDITERKRAQAALEQALADKEILLKEVHHRTKNNMQLISSMLSIQSRRIADDLAKQALEDSSKRINVLASMHRMLYQTSDSNVINVGEQLNALVSSLVAGFRADMTVNQTIDAVYLDVHHAIPFSLIANELLTNVFKHAFVEPRATDTLMVNLQQQADTITLEVRDNGIGLPDTVNQDNLGMVIVQSLTGQLEATFVLENHPAGGTLARVRFNKN